MRKYILITASVLAMLAFSGCTSADMAVRPMKIKLGGKKIIGTRVAGYTHGIASISRAKDAIESSYLAFQIAADYVLDKGDNYFAIYRPLMLSNFDGSPINTMEDYAKKCSTSSLGHVGSSFDAFGLNTYACNIATTGMSKFSFLEIVSYKDKPLDVLVYDAQDVVAYLKANDMYRAKEEFEVEKMIEFKRSLTKWWHKNREKRN